MTVTAIIQARMSSKRLPGKVLLPLCGKPVLGHIIERLSFSALLEDVIVATSNKKEDNPIYEYCSEFNIKCFRGSENDVLDRFFMTIKHFELENIIRVTADCPVIDPLIIDAVILGFLAGKFDYYGLAGSFPDGLDCTAISAKAISIAWENAELASEREHVGPYIEKNPDNFKLGELHLFDNLASERWTLDEERDYKLLTNIFDSLYSKGEIFMTNDILQFLEREPQLKLINKDITRNEGYLKSLYEDKKNERS